MANYRVMRIKEEIDNLLNKATEAVDAGKSKYNGMSYEEGIIAALDWVFGNTDDHPLE